MLNASLALCPPLLSMLHPSTKTETENGATHRCFASKAKKVMGVRFLRTTQDDVYDLCWSPSSTELVSASVDHKVGPYTIYYMKSMHMHISGTEARPGKDNSSLSACYTSRDATQLFIHT